MFQRKENPESVVAPMYNMYKEFVTNFFSGKHIIRSNICYYLIYSVLRDYYW